MVSSLKSLEDFHNSIDVADVQSIMGTDIAEFRQLPKKDKGAVIPLLLFKIIIK